MLQEAAGDSLLETLGRSWEGDLPAAEKEENPTATANLIQEKTAH